MTFVELILAVLLTTALLFLMIGWTSSVRQTAKTELARTMLEHLDTALADITATTINFRRSTGRTPSHSVVVQLRQSRANAIGDRAAARLRGLRTERAQPG